MWGPGIQEAGIEGFRRQETRNSFQESVEKRNLSAKVRSQGGRSREQVAGSKKEKKTANRLFLCLWSFILTTDS